MCVCALRAYMRRSYSIPRYIVPGVVLTHLQSDHQPSKAWFRDVDEPRGWTSGYILRHDCAYQVLNLVLICPWQRREYL